MLMGVWSEQLCSRSSRQRNRQSSPLGVPVRCRLWLRISRCAIAGHWLVDQHIIGELEASRSRFVLAI